MADRVHGLLLAAGEGRRMGMPKALVREDDGTSWLHRSVTVLRDGGCDPITVVLGARAAEARRLLDGSAATVVAGEWADGMGASLRAGLASLGDAAACLLSLVDLPDVGADVVRRVVGLGADPGVLARAAYDGKPGHPVLIGRDHWAGIVETTVGDRGARDYLATHGVLLVECSDLATGADRDTR